MRTKRCHTELGVMRDVEGKPLGKPSAARLHSFRVLHDRGIGSSAMSIAVTGFAARWTQP